MRDLLEVLRLRAGVAAAIRAFFSARGYVEVETPVLASGVASEANISHLRTQVRVGAQTSEYYLVASPETHMKRLLADGAERIFQIARCFRDNERTAQHNPEFSLLEWYRTGADYNDIMDDTEALLRHVARTVRGGDLWPGEWNRWTMAEAFARCAGLDIADRTPGALVRQARGAGITSVQTDDSWEDAFFKVLLEKVEPAIKEAGPTFLYDFPAEQASLARLKAGDGSVAERAELYIDGIELANGFSELTDAEEQGRRFAAEREKIRAQGLHAPAEDRRFLEALKRGMPPAAGMALGVDRLVMLVGGRAEIEDVLPFPIEQA